MQITYKKMIHNSNHCLFPPRMIPSPIQDLFLKDVIWASVSQTPHQDCHTRCCPASLPYFLHSQGAPLPSDNNIFCPFQKLYPDTSLFTIYDPSSTLQIMLFPLFILNPAEMANALQVSPPGACTGGVFRGIRL